MAVAVALFAAALYVALPHLVHMYVQSAVVTRAPHRGYGGGHGLVRGLVVPPFVTDDALTYIEREFVHQEGDVWIATYPKAGTHWTQTTINALRGYTEDNSMWKAYRRCPWLEVGLSLLPFSPQRSELNTTAPRCFRGHWPRRDYFLGFPSNVKVIYVLRNAASSVESYWHHLRAAYAVYKYEAPFEVFFDEWLAGEAGFGDYFDHIASWWPVLEQPNALLIRYEEMKKSPRKVVEQIAGFLNAPANVSVDDVLAVSNFKSMRKDLVGTLEARVLAGAGVVRLGEGEVHNWCGGAASCVRAPLVTPAMRARLAARYDAVLKPLGVPERFILGS